METTNRLPTGTVSFLFSDIEDSTGVLQRLGAGYRTTLERHAGIVRACLAAHRGIEVSTEGDSFFAVFDSAPDAVSAAIEMQHRLEAETWPEGGTIRARVGIHVGTAEIGHDDYVGIDVHRAARIGASGHGGQVVVSEAVRALAPSHQYLDLGPQRLKGLDEPIHLYQLKVAGLREVFPPLRSVDAHPNNLPSLESRILGREREIAEVCELLAGNRLVTITGPGGIGKTRLSIEVAATALTDFVDGVFVVGLAPVSDPTLVMPTIGAVIGVDDVSGDAVIESVSSRSMLLVLDNLEQVTGAAPDVKRLLDGAPSVKALTTSQVPLKLGGECTYRLSPLETGNVDSPAVAVFATRAAEVDPLFDLETHRDAVVELTEALDGVPLALELAAARANVLTPEEILSRMSVNVEMLKRTATDGPDRHRSISAALEWSVDLLTEQQRRLLECFAVFRGGASLSALESVSGADPLDDLSELVEHSLVYTSSGLAGKRFDVLAPIRLFVASRLGDETGLAERHASFFHQMAVGAEGPLEGDRRPRWVAILGDNHENIQKALEFLHDSGDARRGFEMLGAIWRYHQVAGRFNELELWLERFFSLAGSSGRTTARAKALMARAAIYYWRTDPRAVDDYEEAVDIGRETQDLSVLGYALAGLGAAMSATRRSDLDQGQDALAILEEAKRVFGEIGDHGGLAAVEAATLFTTSWADGRMLPHRADLERLADMYEAAGQRINTAHTILGLAASEVIDGHDEEAIKQALSSLSIAEESGDRFVMAWALEWIATAKVGLGDTRTAALLAGAARTGRVQIGGGWTPATYGIDDAETRVRRALGDEADALLAEGADLSLDAAVDLAKMS